MNRPMTGDGAAGPRPRPGRSRPHRRPGQRPLARILDHSFPLRLLLALVAAGALLGGVNRWEECRRTHFAQGCLFRDPGGIVTVANVEALSIVTAAFLYLLEGRQRRQRENLQAMEVLLSCQQAGARMSQARNDALETLSAQGIWLDGLDLKGAVLDALQAPYGRWRRTNLRQASLQGACLHDTDLQGADLAGADLRQAVLVHADLREADLRDADLRRADLRGADLRGADTTGARLESTLLEGADLRQTALAGTALPLKEPTESGPASSAGQESC